MNKVSISVDKPYYHPGNKVIGNVHIDLKSHQKVREISLDSDGLEWTRITVTYYGRHAHTEVYEAKVCMQKYGCLLYGEGELEPGEYDFPFEYDLPVNLLPTFHGHWAQVVYLIRVNMDIPLWFDAGQTLEIPVVIPREVVRLNERPVRFMSPMANDPTRPGFIVDIEKAQLYSGETIRGMIQLTGDGGKTVRKVDIALQMVEFAEAEGLEREGAVDIASTYIPGEALIGRVKMPFDLTIPRGAYSTYTGQLSFVKWVLSINLDVAWATDTKAVQELLLVSTD